MSWSPNGTIQSLDEPIELGDLLLEQRQVRLAGRLLPGWVVKNRRAPRSVIAALDAARRKFARETTAFTEVDQPQGDPYVLLKSQDGAIPDVVSAYRLAVRKLLARFSVATLDNDSDERLIEELLTIDPPLLEQQDWEALWNRHLTRLAMAVMPTLSETDADAIDQDRLSSVLTELGALRDPNEAIVEPAPTEQGDDEDPKLSTGDSPQPDSHTSTQVAAQTSS